MGGFPEWRARHLACAERGRAWLSCWRTTTHLSEERTGCSNEDREVQIALNEWIRRCWFPLKGVPPLLFNWGRGSLWCTAVEAIVEARRQINIMILCFVSAEQTAHTSYFPKTLNHFQPSHLTTLRTTDAMFPDWKEKSYILKATMSFKGICGTFG